MRGYSIISFQKNLSIIRDLMQHKKKDDYTTSYYVSQNFGMIIEERITCLYCHQNKRPGFLKDDSFILSLGGIS